MGATSCAGQTIRGRRPHGPLPVGALHPPHEVGAHNKHRDAVQVTDSFWMELEFVEVVEYGLFVVVDGTVVSETTSERLVSVVSTDYDYLRQINDSLT